MTVQQLIDELSKLDPEKAVLICFSQSETVFVDLDEVEDERDCVILK